MTDALEPSLRATLDAWTREVLDGLWEGEGGLVTADGTAVPYGVARVLGMGGYSADAAMGAVIPVVRRYPLAPVPRYGRLLYFGPPSASASLPLGRIDLDYRRLYGPRDVMLVGQHRNLPTRHSRRFLIEARKTSPDFKRLVWAMKSAYSQAPRSRPYTLGVLFRVKDRAQGNAPPARCGTTFCRPASSRRASTPRRSN